jgi:hypothetical protein
MAPGGSHGGGGGDGDGGLAPSAPTVEVTD